MKIHFTGHKLTVTTGMQEHLRERLSRYEKYTSRLVDAHAILKKQKYYFEAEVTLSARNFKAFGEGKSKDNIYAAIDQAAVRVEKQLKKYREKLKDHRLSQKGKDELRGIQDSDRPSRKGKRRPDVIETNFEETGPMSVREASAALHSSDETFLIFKNKHAESKHLIYKREDGHHGLVEL